MYCLVTLLVALVATATVVVSTNCTKHECIKNTNYTGIEQSLFRMNENLVNLSQAFFPTNRQPSISVQVTYQFREYDSKSDQAVQYRWLDSPVNLLIDSDLLFYLSLTIYKADLRYVTVTLDPIEGFENENVNSTHPDRICQSNHVLTGHHLLNNLTVNLLSYALHRFYLSRIDLNTERGYSAYVFDSSPSDFCIFNEVKQFSHLRVVLWFSFLALELAVVVATPLLMAGVYNGFKEKMEADESRLRYFVWAFIGVITILVILMYVCNGLAIANGITGTPPTNFTNAVWSYKALMSLLVIFPLLDLGGAIVVMCMFSRIQHEDNRSRFIDCFYINCLFRRNYHQINDTDEPHNAEISPFDIRDIGLERCRRCLFMNFIHLFSIVFVTMFIQLMIFHSIFLSLAVVAAPVEAGSVLILYLASIFTFISFIALVWKMAHTIQIIQESFCRAGVFACVLLVIGVVLFAGFMYLYTILTQEYRNSRGVIAFIGPILPSLLASAVGGILIRIFPCIRVRNPQVQQEYDSINLYE